MEINLLSIESSTELLSVSLKIGRFFFYKEYMNKTYTTKNILQLIDNILLENNVSHEKLDCIIYGDYPTSLTNIKLVVSVIQSLAFAWKIPIVRISSLLTISMEIFLTYKTKDILVISSNQKNIIYCCISQYDDNKLNSALYKNFNSLDCLNDIISKDFMIIVNCSSDFENEFIKKYKSFNIKKKILPKAIYTSMLAKDFIFNNNLLPQNKISSLYFKQPVYVKYNY